MTDDNMLLYFFGGLVPLAVMAYQLGRRKAQVQQAQGGRLHSQPGFYGWYSCIWLVLPALTASLAFALLHVVDAYSAPPSMLVAAALACAAGGLIVGLRAIRPGLAARKKVETVIRWLLLVASAVSILTTLGIVFSIVFEAIKFFQIVSLWEFITGTKWAPDAAFLSGAGRTGEAAAEPKFGAVPIFAGTFMITGIAMLVAVPIGLLSAIFMSEYASRTIRGWAKPVLEILAGIPTVVYGFFAAITVSPLVVAGAEMLGLEADYTNALTPGLVMGVMIIPFISSLSDDIINSIPQSMREGSYALGTTQSETIKHVLLPAALPGIVSAFLLGVSRALGETMIVVMAAGLRPNLTWNPLEGMTTVTVRIVDALTGDLAFDSAETLSAFGLGLTLFVVTLVLNVISTVVIRRFKQQYEL
ncbi:phosphate ABC transporter permease subunit PstC [Desulfovermiculus halophilus]|uniref:phosphate ABC transporter permease subunit PstC n=1 Tax=Desulfovermiculus halophilus TaxID=339722 RepID=UPI000A6E5AB7